MAQLIQCAKINWWKISTESPSSGRGWQTIGFQSHSWLPVKVMNKHFQGSIQVSSTTIIGVCHNVVGSTDLAPQAAPATGCFFSSMLRTVLLSLPIIMSQCERWRSGARLKRHFWLCYVPGFSHSFRIIHQWSSVGNFAFASCTVLSFDPWLKCALRSRVLFLNRLWSWMLLKNH